MTLNPSLSVIILTFNEQKHISRALNSLKDVAADVFVIDSFSQDETARIARQMGAHVYEHEFINYAKQFQWALDNLPISTDWIMRLDADEILEQSLVDEIRQRLHKLPPDISGVILNRKTIFMGKWIKYGGRYPLHLLRMWRTGKALIEDRWMDEHMVLSDGECVKFAGGFADYNLNDLTFFTDKHNKYATREAIDVLLANPLHSSPAVGDIESGAAGMQAKSKRLLKTELYNRMPFWFGPFAYFLFRLVVQLGFLDGGRGIIYHVLQGFWYRFLVAAKVVELRGSISHAQNWDERRLALERLTGFRVSDSVGGDVAGRK